MNNKKQFKFVTLSIMFSVLQVVNISPAHAGNGLFSLFGRKEKQEQTQPAPQPSQPNEQTPKKAIPLKRAVVQTPKIFTYMPEKMVKIDFSKTKFSGSQAVEADIATFSEMVRAYVPFSYIETIPSVNIAEDTQESFLNTNVMAEKDIAEIIEQFYAQEGKLVWSQDFVVSENAKKLMKLMADAGYEGLNPEEYLVNFPDNALTGEEQKQAFYNFDVKLSAHALRYIQDAGEGRIIANRLSEFHDLPRLKVDLLEAIINLSKSDQPQDVVASYFPNSIQYNQLKTALAAFKDIDEDNSVMIKAGTLIRPGQTNDDLSKVLSLIQKNMTADYNEKYKDMFEKHAQATLYDPELVEAVKEYQTLENKKADGVIGPATISALLANSEFVKYQRVKNSMDRLRWLPHDFTKRYVFINQPAFTAEYYNDGKLALEMKVVVGSKNNQTTFFYDNISMVQFNPSWGVPRSIVLNEMLPRIVNDPSYLNRNGYKVYNGKGQQVAQNQVDWAKVASNGYGVNIRQSPGRGNALGELKILFPNKHDIYLHDTPSQGAFNRDMRAISHGCVRLEHPRVMAAAVLNKQEADLPPYFKKPENTVRLEEKVPVYLTYFTAWPDNKTGEIRYFDDMYSRDDLMNLADEKIRNARLSQ